MHSNLKDTPLIVNPNSQLAHRPAPVSLPYDLPQLPPPSQPANLVHTIQQQTIPSLDSLVESYSSLSPSTPTAASTYSSWEQHIRRLNPGYTQAADVMAPTKRS